jgi:outer membrane immunogenic protein
MKFKIAALAAGVVLSGPSALAADLAPMPVEPAAPLILPFDWSGFYVGVNAGYGLGGGDASIYTNGLPAPVNLPAGIPGDIGNLSTDGFLGGAQVGYNVQFGTWVVGIEGDIDYFNGEDEVSPELTSQMIRGRLALCQNVSQEQHFITFVALARPAISITIQSSC